MGLHDLPAARCPDERTSCQTSSHLTFMPLTHYIAPMRTLFILLLIANLSVFALGQGWFGTPGSQLGRTLADRIAPQINPDALEISPGQLQIR